MHTFALKSEVILFLGGLAMGVFLTLGAAIGWASAAAVDRIEAAR